MGVGWNVEEVGAHSAAHHRLWSCDPIHDGGLASPREPQKHYRAFLDLSAVDLRLIESSIELEVFSSLLLITHHLLN